VLRIIGGKREWTKKYSVAHELVKNPLTPIEVSMKHITRLSAMDLKRLTRDRGVPEIIRRQAKKMTTPKK
jgi:nitrogen fixation/metabolism regulation signal transduction histidine kinase